MSTKEGENIKNKKEVNGAKMRLGARSQLRNNRKKRLPKSVLGRVKDAILGVVTQVSLFNKKKKKKNKTKQKSNSISQKEKKSLGLGEKLRPLLVATAKQVIKNVIPKVSTRSRAPKVASKHGYKEKHDSPEGGSKHNKAIHRKSIGDQWDLAQLSKPLNQKQGKVLGQQQKSAVNRGIRPTVAVGNNIKTSVPRRSRNLGFAR